MPKVLVVDDVPSELEIICRILQDAGIDVIRAGDGELMFDHFTKTRAIRRSIVALGQDDARPDFGRGDHG